MKVTARPPQPDPAILRVGLEVALEFGENWLQPIQPRLARRYPDLSAAERDECDRVCREAMNYGHAQVPGFWRAASGDERAAFARWSTDFLARYPWASAENLKHTFSQGRYYAWKDGDL